MARKSIHWKGFKAAPGKLWRIVLHAPSGANNIFLTAPTAEDAIKQAKTIPLPKDFEIGEATEALYVLTAPAPPTEVLWLPK